jgi:hypothetical protein
LLNNKLMIFFISYLWRLTKIILIQNKVLEWLIDIRLYFK